MKHAEDIVNKYSLQSNGYKEMKRTQTDANLLKSVSSQLMSGKTDDATTMVSRDRQSTAYLGSVN